MAKCRCPICNKPCKSNTALLQHLNQPRSRCHPSLHPSVLGASRRVQNWGVKRPQVPANDDDSPMDVDTDYNVSLFVSPDEDSAMDYSDPATPSSTGPVKDYYKGAAKTYGRGDTFLDKFHKDQYREERQSNLYYPFASADEWELASYLTRSNMTIADTDEFLNLRLTSKMDLSFQTAKDLRSRIESLPSGPAWMSVPWKTTYPTKKPLTLYYRDPLECIQNLLANPLVQDFIQFTPFRLWKTAERLMRVYTEWLSGDVAWGMQDRIPAGATIIGTVLSSDKTQLTSMTGNRQAHPLLISLADIDMDFRMKASHHAFLLLAFSQSRNSSSGTPRLGPLKKTAEIGMMMTDPLGWRRFCFTPLLRRLEKTTDPWDLRPYIKKAKLHRLNDWPLAEPSAFLTPEMLHHWFKFFFDHVVKWCIAALGAAEIDFRFSILRPHTGMRHFKEGISKAKQVTGREHRDMMRYIVPGFLKAIAMIVTFFYHGQAPAIDEDVLDKMENALSCFHQNKQAILKAGVRKGKKGPINNWHIPKLEFLQSVIPAIRANGVPLQWTADVTEHAHISEVKDPASNSNNQNYESQICRHLDRRDKCRHFDLATAMDSAGVDLGVRPTTADNDADGVLDDTPLLLNRSSKLLEKIEPVASLSSRRARANYFAGSLMLLEGKQPTAPLPFRTFTSTDSTTALHLNRDHVGHRLRVAVAATKFNLPDLLVALLTFIQRPHDAQLTVGGRRPKLTDQMRGFTYLQVWHSVRIQGRSFHDPKQILVPETINAEPPIGGWKFGRGDAVIVNLNSEHCWPHSGLEGHAVCQLKMIFRIVPWPDCVAPTGTDEFLAYVQRFNVVHQIHPVTKVSGPFREPTTGMYQLKRARRADGSPMGDVVPLERLRAKVELSPRHGKTADKRLKHETTLDYCQDFHLDHFFNKELFWALTQ
ncbi:hypothetical protein B0H13DRAFT_2241080 [Mycena leptocephala]|nr:hypothetical protein B0H13DRAFT_2241080 [Mycena leptocephala]